MTDGLTLEFILDVWSKGGSLMIPLALLCVLIFHGGSEMVLYFLTSDFRRLDEREWTPWIAKPSEGRGEIGEIIRYCMDGKPTIKEVQDRFAEVRFGYLPRVDRRIFFLSILVSLAPLMGLLGTVTGMLTTFQGLSGASGKVIDLVASGISEALITTQVGLTIAVPGSILVFFLNRRRQHLAAFLARLETKLVQQLTNSHPA